MRLIQHRPCLVQLLVDFRRIDLGKQLAFGNVRADVHIPRANVAIDSGINRGLRECLYHSRQSQIRTRFAALRMNHMDRLHVQLLCRVRKVLIFFLPRFHSKEGRTRKQHWNHKKPQQSVSASR